VAWLDRLRGSGLSLLLALGAIGVGWIAAFPWLPGIARLGARSLQDGLWAVGAFVAAAAVASLLAVVAMGLLQWRLASRRFDRMLRMTHAEAREAAREERPRAIRRPRWRLA
jgi:flagellar biosynthesis protein FlhB